MKPPLSIALFGSILISSFFSIVSSEKILVAVFMSSKSHKITYMRLIEELANRGHEITVVSPLPPLKEVKGIKEIFTLDADKQFFSNVNPVEMKEQNRRPNPFQIIDNSVALCSKSLDLPQVKGLLNETFDLIFTQPMLNECALGLFYRLKAPLVLFSPISAPSNAVAVLGGFHPTSFVPYPFLDYSDEMTFTQRFVNFGVTYVLDIIGMMYYFPKIEAIYREKLGQDIPSIMEIMANSSLLLSNGHFSLHRPKPYLPNVVDVGGIHSRPAEPLVKDLEDFVSKSGKEGFILFSMGSIIKGKEMPKEKVEIFRKVFSKLKQQVVWKWDDESMPNLPKNVMLSKWLPQQDLLGHPSIKMFITHCGGGGTEEAIYHGVPLIGIPMYGDQLLNAMHAKRQGFLIDLDWNELTEDQLMNAITEILNDRKYKKNVQRLSSLFKDQPDKPLDRGVYWIEYVLRHKGAPHLQSAGRKLNIFQYHSIDVMAAYGAIIGLIICIGVTLVKFIVWKIYSLFVTKQISGSKKIN